MRYTPVQVYSSQNQSFEQNYSYLRETNFGFDLHRCVAQNR